MTNAYGAPEITVDDLASRLSGSADFVLLDVREPAELELVKIDSGQLVKLPLSLLARKQLAALDEQKLSKDETIIVICHHGVRSAQVTAWMRQNGWTDVWSLAGGIEAYAREIDPEIGFY